MIIPKRPWLDLSTVRSNYLDIPLSPKYTGVCKTRNALQEMSPIGKGNLRWLANPVLVFYVCLPIVGLMKFGIRGGSDTNKH